jgi:hypothetical protein
MPVWEILQAIIDRSVARQESNATIMAVSVA